MIKAPPGKIVVVTQQTAMAELAARYNTAAQAKFRLKQNQVSVLAYESEDDAYSAALGRLRAHLPQGVTTQYIDRSFLPNFLFGDGDIVIALGRDGLVVNIAKYLKDQPLIGVNPDPARIDGVLARFRVGDLFEVIPRVLSGTAATNRITLAQAKLADGQTLHAVNDLFIGQRTHVSARYRLEHRSKAEDQISSGIIVSTGAGSTGWLRSILTGAAGVVEAFVPDPRVRDVRAKFGFDAAAPRLVFSVREPFISKASEGRIVFESIEAGEEIVVTSQMPQGGVIFSDGVESDFLEFNSGSIARIGVAGRKVRLVVG